MRVEVEVTQQDIDEGAPFNCWDCPVARALERALGYPVEVGGITFTRRPFREGETALFAVVVGQLPMSAQAFVKGFDRGDVMTPFKFTVEVPE